MDLHCVYILSAPNASRGLSVQQSGSDVAIEELPLNLYVAESQGGSVWCSHEARNSDFDQDDNPLRLYAGLIGHDSPLDSSGVAIAKT